MLDAATPRSPAPTSSPARSPALVRQHVADHGAGPSDDLDRLCGQRDAHTSLLYWHTDLESACAAARASGRRILSLRLLGPLTDELSCANSRFFRTTLYPDPMVNALLREGFVLHWQSVRPCPRVTIELGDGRTLVRTLTGNSVHLVLDAGGRPLDALPGLWTAAGFVGALRAHAAAHVSAAPSASPTGGVLAALEPKMDPTRADRAGALAATKMVVEAPLLRAVRELFATVAEDERTNARTLRPRIQREIARGALRTADALTSWIYRDVFLMPDDDPWLGLRGGFAAIERDGVETHVGERHTRSHRPAD